jgi:hypothetical protein
MMILGKHSGWQAFGPRNKLIAQAKGSLDSKLHHRNFLDCIKNGQAPNAVVEKGHLSASLCHLANIATRTGRILHFDPETEKSSMTDDPKPPASSAANTVPVIGPSPSGM